jgi:YfiH family protein
VNTAVTALLRPFPEWDDRLAAAFTTRGLPSGERPADPYDRLNLGFRSGGDRERAAGNWRAALAAGGLAGLPLAMPRMIHGDAWADADAFPDPPSPARAGFPAWEPEGCDALAASVRGRVLAVTMADCLTALVWDPGSGTIAAVHAGWRGTRAGILRKLLRALAGAGRIRPAGTWVAFGPCLRPYSLAVGPEVAAQLDPRFLIRREGKIWFDMPADNRAQALECGIAPERIRDLGGDTFSEPERYFSYRRDGAASGRLAAFICLR